MDLSMMGPGAVRVARSLAQSVNGELDNDAKSPEESWDALRGALAQQIAIALDDEAGRAVPLGTWLMEDIVLQAYEASDGVSGRARALLGIPETTFRRRLRKATSKARAELLTRKPHWRSLAPTLGALVRTKGLADDDVLQRARRILLEEVVARTDDPTIGAALMGVTGRTFRRWVAAERDRSVEQPLFASAG